MLLIRSIPLPGERSAGPSELSSRQVHTLPSDAQPEQRVHTISTMHATSAYVLMLHHSHNKLSLLAPAKKVRCPQHTGWLHKQLGSLCRHLHVSLSTRTVSDTLLGTQTKAAQLPFNHGCEKLHSLCVWDLRRRVQSAPGLVHTVSGGLVPFLKAFARFFRGSSTETKVVCSISGLFTARFDPDRSFRLCEAFEAAGECDSWVAR